MKIRTESDVVFVDLDGTLCDTHHRLHLVDMSLANKGDVDAEEAMWRRYGEACGKDGLNRGVAALMDLLYEQYDIYLTSGRTEAVRAQTEEWLTRHSIIYDELYMRPIGNRLGNGALKAKWVEELHEKGHTVVLAIDDYHSAVKSFEAIGVPCVHVASLAGWDLNTTDKHLDTNEGQ
jgi:phosphoglycolate phosphatase-like HAD superfamily hydrolase